jgi:hypothetical protein
MLCPHCSVVIHEDFEEFPLFHGIGKQYLKIAWSVLSQLCPDCEKPIILLVEGKTSFSSGKFDGVKMDEKSEFTQVSIWPRASNWTCAIEVPDDLKEDFLEAAEVLSISPKASAALSRRCLQNLLVGHANVKSKDLSRQIQEAIDNHALPSDLSSQLDAIRNIGNFAAHPQKDKSTGEILPVEPAEAEWNLEVLDDLFDHYFVKPARIKERTEELNKKLVAAGKPPLPV